MNICIAHGGDMGEPSGGTNRVSAIASGLQAQNADVTLVIPTPSGDLPERLRDVSVRYVDVPLSTSITRGFKVTRTAQRIARENDALLQIEHSSLAGIGTLHGLDEFVLDMHDLAYSRFDHVSTPAVPLMKRGVEHLERRAVRRAKHVVVVSERMGEILHDQWGVPRSDITIVPNGYFPETLRGTTDVEPVAGRVTFFGTLHPKVDVETLAAVGRLSEVTDLVVIGDGAQRERLERLAESVDALRLTGRLPDSEAFRLVASAEVAINPQVMSDIQRASSPVKLAYYAALGRPMVLTPGPSLVEHLVTEGAAIAAYSTGRFTERVQAVLSNEELAATLATNAKRVAKDLEWSIRVDSFADLYSRENMI